MKKEIVNVMIVAALCFSTYAAAQTSTNKKVNNATCSVSESVCINNNTTVGEMAVNEPKSIKLYKRLGIDYCCLGNKNLKEALSEKKITPEIFTEKLELLKKEPDVKPVVNYTAMTPEALAGYIENTHHEYLRESLPEASALFEKVLRVHGDNHPELYEAYKLFGALKTNLEQHLIKEETQLFPKIEDLNNPEVKEIAAGAKEEHEEVAELMEKLRGVAHDYVLLQDACASYKSLYTSLQAIEEDLHQHIHLENNILLKNIDV